MLPRRARTREGDDQNRHAGLLGIRMVATAVAAHPHEHRGTTNSEDETWLLRRRKGPVSGIGGRKVTALAVLPEDQAARTLPKRAESMYDQRHREHSRNGCL